MLLLKRLILISFLSVFSTASFALTVGQKALNSTVNQKLDAQIELKNIRRDEAANMSVTLASPSVYERMGVERSPILENLKFNLQKNESGKHYVHITSDFIVSKPFFTFLVELNWGNGRLLRELTIFMDPPIFLDENLEFLDTVVPPQAELLAKFATTNDNEFEDLAGIESLSDVDNSRIDFFDTALVEKQFEAKKLTPANSTRNNVNKATKAPVVIAAIKQPPISVIKKAPVKPVKEPTSLVYNKVKKNEILWRIAAKIRPANVTVEQMMLALQKENPLAFNNGNLSSLKVGSVLRIKDISTLTKVTPEKAKLEVSRQHTQWLAQKNVENSKSAVTEQAQKPVVEFAKLETIPVSEVVSIANIEAQAELENPELKVTVVTDQAPIVQPEMIQMAKPDNNGLIVMANSKEQLKAIVYDMLLADKELLGLIAFSILFLIVLSGWVFNRLYYRKFFAQKQLLNPLEAVSQKQNENASSQTTVVQFGEASRKNVETDFNSANKQPASINS